MLIQTLPTGPFLLGAGLAVLISALFGARLGAGPLPGPWRICTLPGALRGGTDVGSWLGAALLAALLAAGFWGSRDPLTNPLPLAVWTVVWAILPALCLVFGDLWRSISPWRGPVRLARRLLGRKGGIGLARLGSWPAVAGLLAFAWFEIVSLSPADPEVLARVVGLYWLAIFLAAVAEGEDWLDRGEALTRFFALLSLVAPLWRAEAEDLGKGPDPAPGTALMAGWPGSRLLSLPPLGAADCAFILLLVSSVTFDGLSESFAWLGFLGVNPLEFHGRSSVYRQNSLGLVAVWALMAVTVLGALKAGGLPRQALAALLPIAGGYHAAHYLVAGLTGGQYLIAALNDPFGQGAALLGLPHHWVSFGFLADRAVVATIWAIQFLLILLAHLLAVRVTLRLAPGAARAHVPLAVLMVGLTTLGLWLLSTPAAG